MTAEQEAQAWKLSRAGLSHKRIAEEIGAPKSTVWDFLNRPRAQPGHECAQEANSQGLLDGSDPLGLRRSREEQIVRGVLAGMEAAPDGQSGLRTPQSERNPARNADAIIMADLADLHAGALVRRDETHGLNHYDSDEFARRFDLWADLVLRWCERMECGDLWVSMLGDLVDSEGIYQGHDRHVDCVGDQQVGLFVAVARRAFGRMGKHLDSLTIRATDGNHRRVGRQGEHGMNLDRMCVGFLAGFLEADGILHDCSFDVEFHEQRLPFQAPIGGPLHCIAHGDQVRAYGRVPAYKLGDLVQDVSSFYGHQIDFLHVGHFHSQTTLDVKGAHTVLVSGSMVGTSELGSRLNARNLGVQRIFGFDKSGMTWQADLVLSERTRFAPDARGILREKAVA